MVNGKVVWDRAKQSTHRLQKFMMNIAEYLLGMLLAALALITWAAFAALLTKLIFE